MEQSILDILHQLTQSRLEFFRRPYLYRRRDDVTNQFLATEVTYMQLLTGISERRRAPITITFPMTLPGFLDPVPVLPSAAQISSEVEDWMTPGQSCAICQEPIVSDGARLRVCQHVYHKNCIQTWFCASARCPVCRRDIREGPGAQTSAASTETPSQSESQWGGEGNL